MDRNKIKIICKSNKTLYYFQNENLEWNRISSDSILSRKEYTDTYISHKAIDIIHIINEIYNPHNRGVDILFEGSDTDYTFFYSILTENYPDSNISCMHCCYKIAIAGKCSSGKTTLLKALSSTVSINESNEKYTRYTDSANTTWYEVNGIDFGIDNIEKTKATIQELLKYGLTNFIYCISTGKIELAEEQLLQYVHDVAPTTIIHIVLTSYAAVNDDINITNQYSSVISVLAKDLSTRAGIISAFGVNELAKQILR